MQATLLCPGPSLARYKPAAADLTIAVNRAGARFGCDVWAVTDWELIQQHHERLHKQTRILTTRACANLWTALGHANATHCVCLEAPTHWDLFTATTALVWAHLQGVTHIDVYGADLSGEADFDAEHPGRNRSDDRWHRELEVWESVTAWLAAKGTTVTRHEL